MDHDLTIDELTLGVHDYIRNGGLARTNRPVCWRFFGFKPSQNSFLIVGQLDCCFKILTEQYRTVIQGWYQNISISKEDLLLADKDIEQLIRYRLEACVENFNKFSQKVEETQQIEYPTGSVRPILGIDWTGTAPEVEEWFTSWVMKVRAEHGKT